MQTLTKSSQLERKTYRTYQSDGILDLIIGLSISGFGVFMLTGNAAFLGMAWLPVLLYLPLKNRFTVPRYGYVKFTISSRHSVYYILSMAVGIVALAFMFGFIGMQRSDNLPLIVQAFTDRYEIFLLGCFLNAGLIAIGAIIGLNRFYYYAAFVATVTFLIGWLGLPAEITVVGIGLVITTVSVIILIQFSKRYPVQGVELSDAS